MSYAATTTVPVGRTRDEIERTLGRYGATGFMFGQDESAAAVAFLLRGRHLRFHVPLPSPTERRFTHTPTGQKRTAKQAETIWQTYVRARWRSIGLIIKAKLEAVESGVVEFDVEFMPQMVMPDGRTVGEAITPQLTAAIEGNQTPALLPRRN